MSGPRIPIALTAPAWAAFRRHSLEFLAEAYRAARPRIQAGPSEETDITGYLCEALVAWFRANPRQAAGFDVHDDPHIIGSGLTGKKRPRADIVIVYTAGARPEFIFEAKKLHRPKAPASRYTGAKGMGCFVSGRYARDRTEAGMIGYVQTDTLEFWRDDLRARSAAKPPKLNVADVEGSVVANPSFPHAWSSTHRRKKNAPIRLLHLLLDCR